MMESDKEKFREIQKKISLLKLRQPERVNEDTLKKLGIHSSRFTDGLPECRPTKTFNNRKNTNTPPMVASETLDEPQKNDAEQEDILDLLEKLKGRWVEQKVFLDKNTNANFRKIVYEDFTLYLKNLQRWRESGNVMWSRKNQKIGMDKAGQFLERTGKDKRRFRYRYR